MSDRLINLSNVRTNVLETAKELLDMYVACTTFAEDSTSENGEAIVEAMQSFENRAETLKRHIENLVKEGGQIEEELEIPVTETDNGVEIQ